MKTVAIICMVLAVTSANVIPLTTHFVRTPAHDSAFVRSDRLGDSFAYSVLQNQAYAAVSPFVSHVTRPVAVSYAVPESANVQVKTAQAPGTGVTSGHAAFPYVYGRPYVFSHTPNVEVKTAAEVPEAEVKTVHTPSTFVYGTPHVFPITPNVEVKSVEVPETEVKTAHTTTPFVYGTPHVFPFTPNIEVKSAEVPETQVKTVYAPSFVYGTPYAFPFTPNVEVKSAEVPETEMKTVHTRPYLFGTPYLLPQTHTQGGSGLTYTAQTGTYTYPITSGFPFTVVSAPTSGFAHGFVPAVAPAPVAAVAPDTAPEPVAEPETAPATD